MKTRVQGLPSLGRRLRALPDDLRRPVADTIRGHADAVLRDMKARVPVDTGLLRDQLTARVSKDGLKARVGFIGKRANRAAFHARFVEFGTRAHRIVAKLKDVLASKGAVFGAQVWHPGVAARPFVFPAWRSRRDRVRADVKAKAKDALRAAARR